MDTLNIDDDYDDCNVEARGWEGVGGGGMRVPLPAAVRRVSEAASNCVSGHTMLFLAYLSDAGITTIVESASVKGDGGVIIVVGTVGTVDAAGGGGGGGGKTIVDSRMTMLLPPLLRPR